MAAKFIPKSPQIIRDKTNWWAGWKECTNFIIVTCHELELGGVRVAHPVSIGTKIIIQYPRRGRDPSRPAQPRPTKIVNKITKNSLKNHQNSQQNHQEFTGNCFGIIRQFSHTARAPIVGWAVIIWLFSNFTHQELRCDQHHKVFQG